MKTKLIRLVCMVMAFLMCMGMGATAFAATTEISNQDNDYDYFEYENSTGWHDLNTPYHYDASGNIAYCVEHEKDPPSSGGTTYEDFNAAEIFSGSTVTGIQAILDHGYPVNSGGLSSAEAHYATANAIRAWIRESAGQGYNFMLLSNNNIRAKSGADNVWSFFTQLLGYARSGATTGGSSGGEIVVSAINLTWRLENGLLVTELSVQAPDGYTISPSNGSVSISGYTGGTNDYLTITAPTSLMGTDVSLYLQGKGGGTSATLYWYEPASGTSKQRVVVTQISTGTPDSGYVYIRGEFYDLTVNKVDTFTGSALDGAVFTLTSGGSPVGLTNNGNGSYTAGGSATQFTTSGGTATIQGLPAGDYQLNEASAPSAAYTVSSALSVRLDSNKSVSVENTPTQLHIEKTDALTGKAMANVAFSLLDASGKIVKLAKASDGTYRPNSTGSDTFLTDASGKATIVYLPQGSYKLKEAAISGYAAQADISVSLSGSKSVSVKNTPLSLTFTKADSISGSALDGGVFQLTDATGAVVKLKKISDGVYYVDAAGANTFTTSSGKAALYYLLAQTYTITELTAPSGYNKDAPKTVTVTATGTEPVEINMTDEPLALRFTKTDDISGEKLDGATFSLLDAEGNAVKLRRVSDGLYTPDVKGETTFATADGEARIAPIPTGKYSAREVEAAPGYAIAPDVTATITEGEETLVSMSDAPLALTVNKTDSETGKPIGGAGFKLLDADGKAVKLSALSGMNGWLKVDKNGKDTFIIPESGTVSIAYLPQGEYSLSEVSAAAGYALSAETATATVKANNTYLAPASVAVTNAPLAFQVHKIDASDGSVLANVAFRIKDADGEYLRYAKQADGSYHVVADGTDTFYTDADGLALIKYIEAGEYSLEEIQYPGFAPAEPQSFTVTQGNAVTVPARAEVENCPLYLEIAKTDALDESPLDSVPFKLIDADGNALHFTKQESGAYKVAANGDDVFKTDADGTARITHIPAGEYTLTELTYDGYALHEPVKVNVANDSTAENPASVALKNLPTAVKLIKTDKSTGEVLANAIFSLLDEKGAVISLARMEDGSYRPASAVTDKEAVVNTGDTFRTGSDGMVTINYLKHGKYSLKEQQIAGYVPLTDITFELTEAYSTDKPLEVKVENIPAQLIIEKSDGLTLTALTGSTFTVLNSRKAPISFALQKDGSYRPARNGEDGITVIPVDNNARIKITHLTGTVTVREVGAPDGYGLATDITVDVGKKPVSYVGVDEKLVISDVEVSDLPLTLKIYKIHAKTQKPLKGAAFQIVSESNTSVPLTFTEKDGAFWYAADGKITTITTNDDAQAVVYGLPVGKYQLVETVVPRGFFPAAPQTFTVQLANTTEAPVELTITNTPEVKLGLDADKWDTVLLIGAVVLLLGSGAFLLIRKRKGKKTK